MFVQVDSVSPNPFEINNS